MSFLKRLFGAPDRAEITAILDWELAHIGDFRADLASILRRAIGSVEHGSKLASGFSPRTDFLAA